MTSLTAAELTRVSIQHVHLAARLRLDRRVIEGFVVQHFGAIDTLDAVVFDVSPDLVVHRAVGADGSSLSFERSTARYGDALRVALPHPLEAGATSQLRIFFSTSPEAAALSWTRKPAVLVVNNGTLGARSWFPCVDAPSSRCGYTLHLNVPTGYTVVCTAPATKQFTVNDTLDRLEFAIEQPIAPYQLGLVAVPKLEQLTLEPDGVDLRLFYSPDSAAALLGQQGIRLPHVMQKYTKSLGAYPWVKYSVVVLPHDNLPRLVHYPTLLLLPDSHLKIKDGVLQHPDSLERLLAEDLAATWLADTIAPATWEHAWVGPSLATLMARRYLGSGNETKTLVEHMLGVATLARALDALEAAGLGPEAGSAFTRLVADLCSDDAPHPDMLLATRFHAEKGYCLLRYLELHAVGDPIPFAVFLKRAAAQLRFTVCDSKRFVELFVNYFGNAETPGQLRVSPDVIDWRRWLAEPGLPPDFQMPEPSDRAAEALSALERRAAEWRWGDDLAGLPSQAENLLFLEMLAARLTDDNTGTIEGDPSAVSLQRVAELDPETEFRVQRILQAAEVGAKLRPGYLSHRATRPEPHWALADFALLDAGEVQQRMIGAAVLKSK